METTIVYRGNIGIMEKKMETTLVYRGNIGLMKKKMAHLFSPNPRQRGLKQGRRQGFVSKVGGPTGSYATISEA